MLLNWDQGEDKLAPRSQWDFHCWLRWVSVWLQVKREAASVNQIILYRIWSNTERIWKGKQKFSSWWTCSFKWQWRKEWHRKLKPHCTPGLQENEDNVENITCSQKRSTGKSHSPSGCLVNTGHFCSEIVRFIKVIDDSTTYQVPLPPPPPQLLKWIMFGITLVGKKMH